MDCVDKKILDILQNNFPVAKTPFAVIGEQTGIGESDVISRVCSLKQAGIIRQISPIFDSNRIGYKSTLAAFKVSSECIEKTAEVLNSHRGVSHNYLRNGIFNIWFTLTIPGSEDLKNEIEMLSKKLSVDDWLYLPTIRKFKVEFTLDMGGSSGKNEKHERTQADKLNTYLDLDTEFIQVIQDDIPLISNPFRAAAEKLKKSEQQVIETINLYIRRGLIRRFAAVLKPINAGFTFNVLVAWETKDDVETVNLGTIAAGINAISHCYQRPSYENWPYSVYTMIHGKSGVECDDIINYISSSAGVKKYCKLTTLHEFKKERVRYYEHVKV